MTVDTGTPDNNLCCVVMDSLFSSLNDAETRPCGYKTLCRKRIVFVWVKPESLQLCNKIN